MHDKRLLVALGTPRDGFDMLDEFNQDIAEVEARLADLCDAHGAGNALFTGSVVAGSTLWFMRNEDQRDRAYRVFWGSTPLLECNASVREAVRVEVTEDCPDGVLAKLIEMVIENLHTEFKLQEDLQL